MGFFENLGRKVGEFTQEAKQAAADEAGYACEDCGERFYTAHDACPACGSENVIELEVADASSDDGDGENTEAESADASEPADASDTPEPNTANTAADADANADDPAERE